VSNRNRIRTFWVLGAAAALLFCVGGTQAFAGQIVEKSWTKQMSPDSYVNGEGDTVFPGGVRVSTLKRMSPLGVTPGQEFYADKATVYDGADPAYCSNSFAKGMWLAQYGLEVPKTPGTPISINTIEMIAGWNAARPDSVLEIKICDDYTEADNTDPCQGNVFVTEEFDFGAIPGAGAFYLTVPLTTPLVFDDGAGGGLDPGDTTVTIQMVWKTSPGGPVDAPADGSGPFLGFWCGDPDLGYENTPFLWRDQDLNGSMRRTGGCAGGACDVRVSPDGTSAKWTLHIYGSDDDPLVSPLGMDLLSTTSCSTWQVPPGFIFDGMLDFDDNGNDCSGGVPNDDLTGTVINVQGAPMGASTNIRGPADTAIFRYRSAHLLPGESRGPFAIDLWGLSLESSQPFTVTRGGGAIVEQWNLHLCLADGTIGAGEASYNRGACSVASLGGNLGTLDFSASFYPKFIMTRVGAPCTVTIDAGALGLSTLDIQGSGPYFDGATYPLAENPETDPATARYDANCNGGFSEAISWNTSPTKLGVNVPHDAACNAGPARAGIVTYTGSGFNVVASAAQANTVDTDADTVPDAQADADGDGIADGGDNCPGAANACQADADNDGAGDACDNCPTFNPDQADDDSNGVGNACDACFGTSCDDGDDCTIDTCDPVTGCSNVPGPDGNGNGIPDICEGTCTTDSDGDGICDSDDPCPLDPLNDADGDGVCGDTDACPNSVLTPTVIIGTCDSGVPNIVLPGAVPVDFDPGDHMAHVTSIGGPGCTIADDILICEHISNDNKKWKKCVDQLTKGIKNMGLITEKQRHKIRKCVDKTIKGTKAPKSVKNARTVNEP
jgi:hypothetical protein